MFEKKIELLYREIADLINKMIPTEWQEFYLCGDLDEQCSGSVYFFFRINNENYTYYLDIPYEYDVDGRAFDSDKLTLFRLVGQLKLLAIENQLAPWFKFIMVVNSDGSLRAYYDYINWFDSPFSTNDLMDYFEYKYVGNAELANNKTVKMIEKYIADHQNL